MVFPQPLSLSLSLAAATAEKEPKKERKELGYRKSKGRMAVKNKQTKEKGISQLAFLLAAWPGLA